MIIYQTTKEIFQKQVETDIITEEIYHQFRQKTHLGVNPKEKNSWKNTTHFMYQILNKLKIPEDTGITIEYTIPTTNKRIDFILSGYDDKNQKTIIPIEIKQWKKIETVPGKENIIKTYTGGIKQELPHPSYQIWTYTNTLEEFNKTIQKDKIQLRPIVYLHNYIEKENDPLFNQQYTEIIKKAPIFTKHQRRKLKKYIKTYIHTGDEGKIIQEIDKSQIQISKHLKNTIPYIIRKNKRFQLLDEQKTIYETCIKQIKENKEKRTIIIKGEPGTGKSILAMNLLLNTIKKGYKTVYVTKNNTPRKVYTEDLKKYYPGPVEHLLKSSGTFHNTKPNTYDAIIIDEAHRLNEKSGVFKKYGENQIKELIQTGKTTIFLIDEGQKISLKDIGTIKEIKKHAKLQNSKITELELKSQFRCNGSNNYLKWLEDALEIKKHKEKIKFNYDFKVLNTPQELHQLIKEKNKNNNGRIVAGYCWDWNTKTRNNPKVPDIIIDDYKKSMNLENTIWATDPKGINQIGCIHTSQGIEFDYIGVILGPDIQYKRGHIITNPNKRADTDFTLRGIKKIHKENPQKAYQIADEIIKNTYKTLMTRGLKGCYIYCTDKALNEYFKEKLKD